MAYRRLDQILRERGRVSDAQIADALSRQAMHGGRLGEQLFTHGDVNEAELVDALSEQMGVSGVALGGHRLDPSLLDRISLEIAEQHVCLPIAYEQGKDLLHVAFADPLDRESVRTVERTIRPTRLRPMVALATKIHASLTALREHGAGASAMPGDPVATATGEMAVAGCLSILEHALAQFAGRERIELESCRRLSKLAYEVALRSGLTPLEATSLRMAALAKDIATWPHATPAFDNPLVLGDSASILRNLGLQNTADCLNHLTRSLIAQEPLDQTGQILLICRALIDSDGQDCAGDLESWRLNFEESTGLTIDSTLIDNALIAVRVRGMREQLFAPAAEVMIVGTDSAASSLHRACQRRGFRIVRANDPREARSLAKRRTPHVIALLVNRDMIDQVEAHVDNLVTHCISADRLLLVAPTESTLPETVACEVVQLGHGPDESTLAHVVDTLAAIVRSHPHAQPNAVRLAHPDNDIVVTGLLTDLGPADLVQVLAAAQKTVRVDFHRDDRRTSLWFDSGRITRADSGTQAGESVFYDLMAWGAGHFNVRTIADSPEPNISVQTTALLLEALKRMDEGRYNPAPVNS